MITKVDEDEEMDIMGMLIDAKKVLIVGTIVSWLYLMIALFTMIEVF